MPKVQLIVTFLVVMIVDKLLEGSNSLPSIIGVQKCSAPFWFLFVAFAVFCFFGFVYFDKLIKAEYLIKKEGSASS